MDHSKRRGATNELQSKRISIDGKRKQSEVETFLGWTGPQPLAASQRPRCVI